MNTAEILNFPGADLGIQEQRMADTDDGYTRLANELYEELIGANLTKNQAKVAHAVCRKTYGFNKKMDRIADTQIAELTRLPRQKVNAAKKELISMRVLVEEGALIGPNKNLSEWDIPAPKSGPNRHHRSDSHHDSDSVPTMVTKSVTTVVTDMSPQQGHTKDTITKDNKDIKRSSSKNSREFTDDRLKKFLSAHPEAVIYTPSGAKWGTADDLKVAEWIATRVKKINPTCKEPDLKAWANDVRLTHQIDGRTHREICDLFDWASRHHFWHKNVMCPGSLRKQWDRLTMERAETGTASTGAGKPKVDLNNTDWINGVKL
ncbi:replication protein [Kosakonia sp. ML.JS2a]|uniref:replication protein n=1 Tax=Kosakonia sp. ML.JS2a TaxID=2980557 RepID=UPI0021D85A36|nr:replication protein [Kosakonia sp. ML.JS2a]UXY09009.1 replication protein [Kosakonia sp. ML.JS2a]